MTCREFKGKRKPLILLGKIADMSKHEKQLQLPHVVLFKHRRRAPNCSSKLTAELAGKAKTMTIQLGMAQHAVAAKLNLNPARVSEVIHGLKFQDVPFAPISNVINL